MRAATTLTLVGFEIWTLYLGIVSDNYYPAFDEDLLSFAESMAYDYRYIAYLDVLGWSEAVKASLTNHSLFINLGASSWMVGEHITALKFYETNNHPKADTRVIQFSDCIVISTSFNESGLLMLCNHLDFLIHAMVVGGLFVRGGVTVGYIFHKDSIAFGPGLVRAYHLESNKNQAVHPRVILDNEVFIDWRSSDLVRPGTWRLDKDRRYYFDFITRRLNELPYSNNTEYYLSNIKKYIIHGLKSNKTNDNIYPKYVWLRDYFNIVIKNLNLDFQLI